MELFAQFGIAGAGLGLAAFCVVKLLLYLREQSKDNAEDRAKILKLHRDERSEWRDDAARREARSNEVQARSDVVVERLTDAIREIGRKES